MRNILFLIILTSNVFSQNWATINTKWYYDSQDNGSSAPSSSYYLYESTKDTLIQSNICKKIEITFYSAVQGIINMSPEYMYSSNGKVYYFWDNDFKLLYDFSATTGDTIHVFNRLLPSNNPYNITDFRIDSVKYFKDVFSSTTYYALDSFKLQYIRPVSTHGYNLSFGFNVIAENIGSIDLMFPTATFTIPEKDGPLRCFQQDTTWFKWSPFNCDQWVVSVNEISNISSKNIAFAPNPFTDDITVQIPNNFILAETKFTIINNLGQILLTFYPDSFNQVLNLSSLSSSMYFLTVQDNSNKKTIKIIKQ